MPKKAGTNGTKNGHPEPGSPYKIEGELLWKYRALDSEYVKVQTQRMTIDTEIKAAIEAHPVLKELYGRKNSLAAESSAAMKELQEVLKEVEDKLGVNLKECSIDDKTGIVHVHKDGKTVPMVAEAKQSTKKSTKRQAGSARK